SALSALRRANLRAGTVEEAYHEKAEEGVVISASAEPGERFKRDSSVDLTLSRGPKPIRITDYAGKPTTDAQAALTRAGFEVK
ncbi:PASTA domain-containing protein, partial [Escherichia coli]|uniref:PASTA domain-containing protein n=1 Tax=Escherichia coli TaxID=562 RepID=UPI000E217B9C